MSRQIEIFVKCIAQTQVNSSAVTEWLEYLGASPEFCEQIEQDEETSDPALLIALAAKRCYMSFEPGLNPNVTRVRSDFVEFFDNILKSGHGSVLEHAVFTFAIEGVSRVFTAEMNRHRAGVGISEGSMRYIRYRDIPYWLPDSIKLTPDEFTRYASLVNLLATGAITVEESANLALMKKKLHSQEVFSRVFSHIEEGYADLQGIWEEELRPEAKFTGKKHITSMMRRIIPMGVATGGVWTMNARAVRHILALRASSAAEEEILHVFSRIGKLIAESQPLLFGDFSQTPEGYWVPKYSKV